MAAPSKRDVKMEETKRVARILKILGLLCDSPGRRVRRKDLADRCGVSERRITADLEVIKHGLGIDIGRDSRGYYIKSSPKLLSLPIDFNEALSVLLGLKAALDTGAVDANQLRPVTDKLVHVFPEPLQSYMRSYMDQIVTSGPINLSLSRFDHLRDLIRAIEGRKRIEITYSAASTGEVSTRKVDPYSLVAYNGSWELIGYCHLRQDTRVFNVSRIQELRVLSEKFDDPKVKPEDLLINSWGIVISQEAPVDVSLVFDDKVAAYIEGHHWHKSQEIEKLPDGKVRLRLRVAMTDDFVGWILSFGQLVKVEWPRELRQKVTERARAVLELYSALRERKAEGPVLYAALIPERSRPVRE